MAVYFSLLMLKITSLGCVVSMAVVELQGGKGALLGKSIWEGSLEEAGLPEGALGWGSTWRKHPYLGDASGLVGGALFQRLTSLYLFKQRTHLKAELGNQTSGLQVGGGEGRNGLSPELRGHPLAFLGAHPARSSG